MSADRYVTLILYALKVSSESYSKLERERFLLVYVELYILTY